MGRHLSDAPFQDVPHGGKNPSPLEVIAFGVTMIMTVAFLSVLIRERGNLTTDEWLGAIATIAAFITGRLFGRNGRPREQA